MDTLQVYVPVAQTCTDMVPLAPRPGSLKGARIGWLDNMKANARVLLDEIAGALGDVGTTPLALSKNATVAAPDSVMAHLKTCDAVVLAIAD